MSTNFIVDRMVYERYPQPIAAAWYEVRAETSDELRIRRVLDCFETFLRFVGSAFIIVQFKYVRSPHEMAEKSF